MIPRAIFGFFSSVRLTVILLALGIVLVFFGTLDQVHYGVYHTQQRYFESFIAIWQYPATWAGGGSLGWLALPMPGGYIIGPLLIVNLLCGHFRYFRPRWAKIGIVFIHGGVVLLLVGQLATQVAQEEFFMWLDEGGTGNYIESFHRNELVIADVTRPGHRREVVIPVSRFDSRPSKDGFHTLRHPDLPFRVDVLGYLKNGLVARRQDISQDVPPMPFDSGIGAERDLVLFQMEPTYKQNERNTGVAVVSLEGDEGPLGRWLLADSFRNRQGNGQWVDDLYPPQTVDYKGRTYELSLRYARRYLPAAIELIDFTHDRYPGTNIPRNFSSKVRILEGDGTGRQTLIYMNHPLRYAGYTFYQASFAGGDTASMFQVVRNPARWFPYVSSGLISLGLLVQFSISLVKFALKLRERKPAATAPAAAPAAVEGGVR